MSEALGDLKESCRLIKSQLPPHQLSTPTGRGIEGGYEARLLHSEVAEEEELAVRQGGQRSVGGGPRGESSHTGRDAQSKAHVGLAMEVFSRGAQGWLAWVQGK